MWAQAMLDRVKLVARGPRASPGGHLGEPIGVQCVGEGRDETTQIAAAHENLSLGRIITVQEGTETVHGDVMQ